MDAPISDQSIATFKTAAMHFQMLTNLLNVISCFSQTATDLTLSSDKESMSKGGTKMPEQSLSEGIFFHMYTAESENQSNCSKCKL